MPWKDFTNYEDISGFMMTASEFYSNFSWFSFNDDLNHYEISQEELISIKNESIDMLKTSTKAFRQQDSMVAFNRISSHLN